MHLRHLNGTTGATQVLPFLLLQLQFTRPRGCPGPTFPTLCPLRQVSFSVGSATPTNVSCAHFESSSDRSCAPASPATVRRRGDVPPNPNRVGPRSRSAQRPRPRNPPPPRTMRRMTRSTIAPTTATPKLGQFHPVTPDCPNCFIRNPPNTAPTMPTTMSKIMPPPPPVRRLATKPARPPKTIHARILMVEPLTEIVLCVESLRVLPRIRDRVTSPASSPTSSHCSGHARFESLDLWAIATPVSYTHLTLPTNREV